MIIKETINVYRCNVCDWEAEGICEAKRCLLAYDKAITEDDEKEAGIVNAGIVDTAPIHICHWCVAAIRNDMRG